MALGLPDDPGQQRRLLIGLIPLVLVVGYWYFLHNGYVEELQGMQARLEQLEASNAQARMRAPQSRQLEERLAQFERHIERLERLVPRGEEVSRLLNTISERADQIGINVARFTPGPTDNRVHYNRRTFELTVHGSYHEIGRFLSAIGSLPRIITPIELSITPHQLDGEAPQLEASFTIETYVLPEPQQGPANAGAAGA
jgi:type IV pilus assembly protein PilO